MRLFELVGILAVGAGPGRGVGGKAGDHRVPIGFLAATRHCPDIASAGSAV